MKPVRLRPHHALCILTYAGVGYTRTFTRNFDRVVTELKRGRAVEIVAGADDICRGLKGLPARHCKSIDVKRRDRLALIDLRRRLLMPSRSLRLTPFRVRRLRAAFASGAIRGGCAGCSWKGLCDRLVAAEFQGCLLPGRR